MAGNAVGTGLNCRRQQSARPPAGTTCVQWVAQHDEVRTGISSGRDTRVSSEIFIVCVSVARVRSAVLQRVTKSLSRLLSSLPN